MTKAPESVDEVRARAEQDEIEFFFAQFVDMHGKPSAKLVPAQKLDMLFEDGAGFAGFAAGPIGQTPASPDIAAMPDPVSYTPIAFKPGLARLACDVTVEGEPWQFEEGRAFERSFETVIGAAVARETGLRLGSTLLFTHGASDEHGHVHADYAFTVVGILAPTGSAHDRALFLGERHVRALAIQAQRDRGHLGRDRAADERASCLRSRIAQDGRQSSDSLARLVVGGGHHCAGTDQGIRRTQGFVRHRDLGRGREPRAFHQGCGAQHDRAGSVPCEVEQLRRNGCVAAARCCQQGCMGISRARCGCLPGDVLRHPGRVLSPMAGQACVGRAGSARAHRVGNPQ